jgi:hypothetical protein
MYDTGKGDRLGKGDMGKGDMTDIDVQDPTIIDVHFSLSLFAVRLFYRGGEMVKVGGETLLSSRSRACARYLHLQILKKSLKKERFNSVRFRAIGGLDRASAH